MKKQLKYLIIPVLLLLSLSFLPSAEAGACPAIQCWINGTIYRWDTNTALSSVVVANASNATQTATTGANGYFNISWYDYSNSSASGGHNLTITMPTGYTTGNTIIKIEIADAATSNDTGIIPIRPITPTLTGISAGTITRTGATISWTSNLSADNRVKYSKDSGLSTNTFYTSFTNSTTTPSIILSGLDISSKYYYTVITNNSLNNSWSAGSSILNFTTSHGYVAEPKKQVVIPEGSSANKVLSDIQRTQVQAQGTQYTDTQKIIALIAIILVLYIVLGGGGKKRK